MTRSILLAALFFLGISATPPLFQGATETKWSVTKGGKAAGTATLLTSMNGGGRLEFKSAAKAPVLVLLAGKGKLWLRQEGGDVELAAQKSGGLEAVVLPALLLPVTSTAAARVEARDGKLSAYTFGSSKATYSYDANGPVEVSVTTGGTTYKLQRTARSSSNADASNFAIRPKAAAASRLARASGSLFGESDTSVSATAGGRGVSGKGMTLDDGGDYEAVAAIEERNEEWSESIDADLEEFQREGKVGKAGQE